MSNDKNYYGRGHLTYSVLSILLNFSHHIRTCRSAVSQYVLIVVIYLLSLICDIVAGRFELQLDQVDESVQFLDEQTNNHQSDSRVAVVFEGAFSNFGADKVKEDVLPGKLFKVLFKLFESRKVRVLWHVFLILLNSKPS